ncbi:MAG: insulinase family protein [Christensenellaceae bacterium]|jgi:predicted Zn-dependent peptidase|nr:insulinase family protein [Christensenellaceae bacterium]
MEDIIKTYPSGIRMLVRPMPSFKSVATSVHLSVGSRNEEASEHGLSHVVEHMLFRGTKTRTAEEIAAHLSNLGVEYNAYTSDVATCYHTKGLITNLDDCCDIMSDMYFNLQFKDEDFKKEIEVIVQEIVMHEDMPRSVLSDLVSDTFFVGTDYGHPIAGTIKSVRSFKPADVHNYMKKHYTAPNTIVSFAGDITVQQAEVMMKKYFLNNFKDKAKPNINAISSDAISPAQAFGKKRKKITQHNVAVLFPVVNIKHPDKYVLTYINEILSTGMSSRLFTSVRDKLGLVYTISGGVRLVDIGGYYYIWFSCTPKNTDKVLATIAAEVAKIKADGVTAEEMQKVRNLKRADRMFELEDVERTNQRNVTQLSTLGEIEPAEEYLKKLEHVTASDVHKATNRYLNLATSTVCIVGPACKPIKFL